ncbi:multi-sensor signal transduction histidine kinase [Nostoc sp. NIES-4103]|nr:multi-sensor signal transduction histidine kinase [Nostoc sp. NIES-4103]
MTNQDSALVLVVDDDDLTRMHLCFLMQQAGYQVVEASNGYEALNTYTRVHPDIVLLDALMPVMDGFSCCAKLQALSDGESIPVLMITALYDQASVEQAFAVGASDFIAKPIHWPVLSQRVRRLLTANRTMQKLRQQTEQAQLQEAQLRMALSAAHMGIWNWDLQTNKITYSDNLEALYGLEKGTFDGTYKAFINCIHLQERNLVNCLIQQAIQEGTDYDIEFRVVLADGSIRWLASKGVMFHDASGVAVRISGVDMDITKGKQAHAELQRQNQRSQLFADITLKIRQSLQIDEILQTSVKEVQKLLHADRVFIWRLKCDGSFIVVKEAVVDGVAAVSGQEITDPCFGEDYIQQYRQGRISSIPDIEQADIPPCYVKLLQRFHVRAILVVPIFLQNQLWGLIIAHQCVYPRKWTNWEIQLLRQLADQIGIALAQSAILEKETRQRQELARSNEQLQQFAFIASHDLQEPLRKIKTFGERLKTSCSDSISEQGHDYLERMQNAALRMQSLIEDLLTLSRVTTRAQPFVSVNLAQTAQEVLSDLEVRIQQSKGRVELGDLPTIKADPVQMRQLLQNLIGNALKFHRQEVPPIVKIYSQFLNNQSDQVTVNSEMCEIVVEDNGIGFEEKYIDRIFNIFQRLHGRQEYEGTGIGLAICRKIAERHHGSITAQSKPQQGAKFIVRLAVNSHN